MEIATKKIHISIYIYTVLGFFLDLKQKNVRIYANPDMICLYFSSSGLSPDFIISS